MFDRVGGEPTIMAAVTRLYQKLQADELTRPFFDGLEMEALVRKQVGFLSWAFDGPSEYRGRPLRAAHAELVKGRGLSDAHFDAVCRHLRETMTELGISAELVDDALEIVERTRDAVLDR